MAHHVVQRLRDDPERRNLDRRGQLGASDPGAIHGDGQAGDSSRRASCSIARTRPSSSSAGATGRAPAAVRRRAQPPHRRSPLEQAVRLLGAAAGEVARSRSQGHRPQARPQAVVQVASQPALSSRAVTTAAGSTAARRSARWARPRPAAPRRRAVAGRAGEPDRPPGRELHPDPPGRPRGAPPPDRTGDRARRPASPRRPLDLDPHVRRPEGLPHRPGDGQQLLLRRGRHLELLARAETTAYGSSREPRRTRCTSAPSQPRSGVERGDDRDRDQSRVPLPQRGAREREHQHVDRQHGHREQGVEHRRRDEPVDLVEPVPRHRDPRRPTCRPPRQPGALPRPGRASMPATIAGGRPPPPRRASAAGPSHHVGGAVATDHDEQGDDQAEEDPGIRDGQQDLPRRRGARCSPGRG